MNSIQRAASKVTHLPILKFLSPAPPKQASSSEIAGFLNAQRLAFAGAHAIAAMIRPGWTERRAADLLNGYLRDSGVKSFFHQAFVWWGDRTKFVGVKSYADYSPTDRQLKEGEVFILDVAPVVDGFVCDIGYSSRLAGGKAADAAEYQKAMQFLAELKTDLPKMFDELASGAAVCQKVDERMVAAGYSNIHEKYPFSVLGHRVHNVPQQGPELSLLNFGWRSYWSLLSRGLFGQLLNRNFEGEKYGLWAIEPHIGTAKFGVKFEEILCVTPKGSYWIEKENQNAH